MERFLIDTDTASDDAVALVLALQHPDVQVEAITVVAGNMPVTQGVQNALYTVELCQRSVPVYAGIASPLLKPLVTSEDFHGKDGFGEIGLALKDRHPTPGHAANVIVDTINRYPGEITLVALAPLTNIAVALRLDPSIAGKVKNCVVMGGAVQGAGNVTPVAEYNIWVDPEAAHIVFTSSMPLKIVDWNVSRSAATISLAELAEFRQIGTPLAAFCSDIQRLHIAFNQTVGIEGPVWADPLAMAIAIEPELAETTTRSFVAVETRSPLCLGQTVVDYAGVLSQEPNAEIVLTASRERFLALLHRALK